MPAGPPKQVTRERERRAWELRQRCWTEARIAAELGVATSTVCYMLQRKEKELAAPSAGPARRSVMP